MAYLFRPPTTDGVPIGGARLFQFLSPHAVGVSVLITDGVVTQQQFPSDEAVLAADTVYLGGHEYLMSDAEAAVLSAAGYGAFLTESDRYIDIYEEQY